MTPPNLTIGEEAVVTLTLLGMIVLSLFGIWKIVDLVVVLM